MERSEIRSKLEKLVSSMHEEEKAKYTEKRADIDTEEETNILGFFFRVMDSMKFIALVSRVEIDFDIEIANEDFVMDIAANEEKFIDVIQKYVAV